MLLDSNNFISHIAYALSKIGWWSDLGMLIVGFLGLILLRDAGRFLILKVIDYLFYKCVQFFFRHLSDEEEKLDVINHIISDYENENNLFSRLWMLITLPIKDDSYPPVNPMAKRDLSKDERGKNIEKDK